MDNNEKNNDSLKEMNSLFGTNIETPPKEEKHNEDIKSINSEVESKAVDEEKTEEIKEPQTQPQESNEQQETIKPQEEKEPEENIEQKKENEQPESLEQEEKQEEFKPINEPVIKQKEEEHKFINEDYVNKDDNKPLIDSPSNESQENQGIIGEMIDTAEHFDFKAVKVNIALIGFAISFVGAVLYNLIITVPGAVLSYLAYKQAVEGKLTKQDKLLAILGMALGVCCIASLLITKVSSLFY